MPQRTNLILDKAKSNPITEEDPLKLNKDVQIGLEKYILDGQSSRFNRTPSQLVPFQPINIQ